MPFFPPPFPFVFLFCVWFSLFVSYFVCIFVMIYCFSLFWAVGPFPFFFFLFFPFVSLSFSFVSFLFPSSFCFFVFLGCRVSGGAFWRSCFRSFFLSFVWGSLLQQRYKDIAGLKRKNFVACSVAFLSFLPYPLCVFLLFSSSFFLSFPCGSAIWVDTKQISIKYFPFRS